MKKIIYVLVLLLIPFGFLLPNVNADVKIENDGYVIDFNNDDYESSKPLLLNLFNDLIDYFEIKDSNVYVLDDTSFINTNFTNLIIGISNGVYDPSYNTLVWGFTISANDGNENYYNFNFGYTDNLQLVQQDRTGDYYIDFSFLIPPEYVFTKLFDLIYSPLDILLDYIGINQQTLSIGFGSIEWFNLEIVLILKLVLSIMILWVFIKFIYWFFKSIFNMITGWLK